MSVPYSSLSHSLALKKEGVEKPTLELAFSSRLHIQRIDRAEVVECPICLVELTVKGLLVVLDDNCRICAITGGECRNCDANL